MSQFPKRHDRGGIPRTRHGEGSVLIIVNQRARHRRVGPLRGTRDEGATSPPVACMARAGLLSFMRTDPSSGFHTHRGEVRYDLVGGRPFREAGQDRAQRQPGAPDHCLSAADVPFAVDKFLKINRHERTVRLGMSSGKQPVPALRRRTRRDRRSRKGRTWSIGRRMSGKRMESQQVIRPPIIRLPSLGCPSLARRGVSSHDRQCPDRSPALCGLCASARTARPSPAPATFDGNPRAPRRRARRVGR